MWGKHGLVYACVVGLQCQYRSWALRGPLVKRQSSINEITELTLTIFTVPSQDEDANTSFLTFDQSIEKTSRLCSCHILIGRS